MKRIVMLLTVMALMSAMLVAGIAGPASAQNVDVSPTVNAPILSNDKVAAQCVASPLLGTPSLTVVLPGAGGGNQCTQSQ